MLGYRVAQDMIRVANHETEERLVEANSQVAQLTVENSALQSQVMQLQSENDQLTMQLDNANQTNLDQQVIILLFKIYELS